MARNSKYCAELEKRICDAIASEGTDRAGWETGNITHDTFYRWFKDIPAFSEAVVRAREEFTRTRPESDRRQARKSLSEYLYNGNVITWETTGETVRNIEDPDGTVKQVFRETFRKSHTERRPCPNWVFDRILGKNTALLDAVQILLTEGVATEDQARIIAEGVNRVEQELKRKTIECDNQKV